MRTKTKTISISFEKPEAKLLKFLATKASKSVPTYIKELVVDALDDQEDKLLSIIADSRNTPNAARLKHI